MSAGDLLTWLEDSPLSAWVRQADWPYPVLLDLHSIGLAMVVGFSWVIDLRLLGVARRVPLAPLRKLFPAIWLGFFLNAASGIVLFAADATRFFYSWNFRIKLLLIATGMLAIAVLGKRLRRFDGMQGTVFAEPTVNERVFASLSLTAWFGAIVAGRLLAYTT